MSFNVKSKYRILVSLPFLILFSNNVFATLAGTFTGTTSTDTSCNTPLAAGFSLTSSVNLVAKGTTFSLTISDSAGDFTYSGNGTISQSAVNNFTFNITSATVIVDGGPTNLDGTFTDTTTSFTGVMGESSLNFGGVTGGTGTGGAGTCTTTQFNFGATGLSESGVTISSATPGSTLTESVLFNTQMQSTVSNISNRVSGALSTVKTSLRPQFTDNSFSLEGSTGLNAGDGQGLPYGIWGNYSYTNYENDLSVTAFDGSSHGFLGGIDFGVFDNAVLGVALGYDLADIDTGFNAGNQDTDTITIATYFGALLDETLSVDFNIGYSRVDYDQFRTLAGARITSSPEADRWFGSVNLNSIHYVDRWIIGGRVGLLYATSTIDSYTESNGTIVSSSRFKVSTASIGGDVAYSYKEWEPFLNLAYQYDYQLTEISAVGGTPANDNDDILLTTGIRYFEKSGISGNLEYSKRLLREDYDEDRISMTIRIDY